MKKIVLLLLILGTVVMRSYGQQKIKKIVVIDTVQLTGILIYDSKKEAAVLKKYFTDTASLKSERQIKKLIRKSEHRFLDPFNLKTLMARQETEVYRFCPDSNRARSGFDTVKLLFGRYSLVPFKELYFINLTIDG